MTIVVRDPDFVLYHGDALTVLQGLPDESVDIVVTDPPYGDTSLAWDVPVRDWLPLVERLLRPGGSVWIFGSLRSFMALDLSAGWRLAQDVVWEKHNGSSFHADRFRRVHEIAAQFYRGGWADVYKEPQTTADATARTVRRKRRPPHTGRINASSYTSVDGGPRLQRSVIRVRSEHGSAVHPTQKPVGIVTPLIGYSCPIGGTVLDPFAGSGTTLVAARQLGRRSVGIEISEDYCRLAARRLAQLSLLAPFGVGGPDATEIVSPVAGHGPGPTRVDADVLQRPASSPRRTLRDAAEPTVTSGNPESRSDTGPLAAHTIGGDRGGDDKAGAPCPEAGRPGPTRTSAGAGLGGYELAPLPAAAPERVTARDARRRRTQPRAEEARDTHLREPREAGVTPDPWNGGKGESGGRLLDGREWDETP
jgi:site-specific DNA-methyltransferase (adenine-specific)